jgi:hypothetical protein
MEAVIILAVLLVQQTELAVVVLDGLAMAQMPLDNQVVQAVQAVAGAADSVMMVAHLALEAME